MMYSAYMLTKQGDNLQPWCTPFLIWDHQPYAWCHPHSWVSQKSWFHLELHPSNLAFCMMYSAYMLTKQGDNLQPWRTPFLICSMSNSNCCFLTFIQISQEAGQVVRYSHLLKNFPQFIVIHTVNRFGIVNKDEICFSGTLLLFRWSSGCWQFDLWFLCLF